MCVCVWGGGWVRVCVVVFFFLFFFLFFFFFWGGGRGASSHRQVLKQGRERRRERGKHTDKQTGRLANKQKKTKIHRTVNTSMPTEEQQEVTHTKFSSLFFCIRILLSYLDLKL